MAGTTRVPKGGCMSSRRYLGDVCQNELEVDDLDVTDGVDRTVHVDDVVVHEAAHDVHDGVGHADVLGRFGGGVRGKRILTCGRCS